ncbi:MAG: MmgE/PrpD family protein, partial [Chloroflexota bacterium]
MNSIDFIHDLTYDDLSKTTVQAAKRALLDTLGVCITGRQTDLAKIVYDYAAMAHGGDGAQLWLDGRSVSKLGAVLAHGFACDAVDMHDGYQTTKGHAGAAIIPGALALLHDANGNPIDGKELITSIVVAYEIAVRTGVTLHATVPDYHTSGAWNTLGVAAMYARRYGLTHEQTRHALGIAEYHGPRSQMMRCIDHPTMLKDGSGWGAMAGMSAGMLAQAGFTGAPAITVEYLMDSANSQSAAAKAMWETLGSDFTMDRQYFKKYAVCYWAQPAVAATLNLREQHSIDPAQITKIYVETFHEATRLNHPNPADTEIAQYSLPFPIGAALVHGQITAKELVGAELTNPEVLRLSNIVEMVEDDEFNEIFPNDRFCRVTITTADGISVTSEPTTPPWTEKAPPTDEELDAKFRTITAQTLPLENVEQLAHMLWNVEDMSEADQLLAQL